MVSFDFPYIRTPPPPKRVQFCWFSRKRRPSFGAYVSLQKVEIFLGSWRRRLGNPPTKGLRPLGSLRVASHSDGSPAFSSEDLKHPKSWEPPHSSKLRKETGQPQLNSLPRLNNLRPQVARLATKTANYQHKLRTPVALPALGNCILLPLEAGDPSRQRLCHYDSTYKFAPPQKVFAQHRHKFLPRLVLAESARAADSDDAVGAAAFSASLSNISFQNISDIRT